MIAGWMRRKEAAVFITRLGWPVTVDQLEKMAAGKMKDEAGPPSRTTGWRSVWYSEEGCRAWVQQKLAQEAAVKARMGKVS